MVSSVAARVESLSRSAGEGVIGLSPLPVRRALTEAPLLALAGAERHARVTVVGRSDEVAVSVLVDIPGQVEAAGPTPVLDSEVTVTMLDAADRRWVEARWRG